MTTRMTVPAPAAPRLGGAWADRLVQTHRKRRRFVLVTVDTFAWLAAFGVTMLAIAGESGDRSLPSNLTVLAVAVVGSVVGGELTGAHSGRYAVGSFEEVGALAQSFGATGLAILVADDLVNLRAGSGWPTLLATSTALVLTLVPRYAVRRSRDAERIPDPVKSRRAIVFGAGDAGQQIVRALLRDSHSTLLPVALLDDDPLKRSRSINGVRVAGDRGVIEQVARAQRADCLIVAIPSATPDLKQDVVRRAEAAGLDVRILPPLSELVGSAITARDIREVSEADLLGRPQVDIDSEAIHKVLADRVVLVTGAGGSIGSEICRQVKQFGPSELIMLDRDESALHGVQLLLEGRALLSDRNLVVADIRDRERIRALFAERRPNVVFHAAALKHLPLLEMHPDEGIKTNVWGTHHVLEAAIEFETERFVNISTDKAADPVSVLGRTKRLAERLTAHAALRTGKQYVSVRFGNVLGSRGSMLPTFRAQIEAGGPVTVTHPDVTRYFMTTEEAVRLVTQAAVVGAPGEVLVLDMGQPVRIDDVARRLVSRSGRDIEIVYTGLRPGEKLHEQLVAVDECVVSRQHPLIFHTAVPPLGADLLGRLEPASLHALATDEATEVSA